MEEMLDLVNEQGDPLGRAVPRSEAHRLGLRHRTSHVWLVRRKNGVLEVLLQKRSDEKDSFPGCYDISSAGHIPAGQGFVDSALRELKEELGVTAQPQDLILCGQRSFQFSAVFHGKPFKDNQVSNVYLLWLDRDAEEFTLQKEEISAVRWMPLADCLRNVENGALNSCIFPEELRMVQATVEKAERNLIEEIILWESCGKRPSLIFLFCRVTTRAFLTFLIVKGRENRMPARAFPYL